MIALVCQVVLLPAVCFGLVLAFGLAPELAVGMMLLAASPGGTTANLYSHLFGGHVALNITPDRDQLGARSGDAADRGQPVRRPTSSPARASIGLQFDKVLQVFAIVLIPVAIGMLVRARAPRVRRPTQPAGADPVRHRPGRGHRRRVSTASGRTSPTTSSRSAWRSWRSISSAWLSATACRGWPGVDRRAATATGFEIGIHNSTLAITIAVSPALLNNTQMAIPAAVYGIVMFFTAAAFGYLVTRRRTATEPAVAASVD